MRAITLCQPYASLVASGHKRFETRTFAPPSRMIGERIAIAAAAAPHWTKMLRDPEMNPAVVAIAVALGNVPWATLPHGAVVCTAILAGAYRVKEVTPDGWAIVDACHGASPPFGLFQIDHYGDYSPGRWCWYLTDMQALPEPVPAKGKQGWWEWEAAPC